LHKDFGRRRVQQRDLWFVKEKNNSLSALVTAKAAHLVLDGHISQELQGERRALCKTPHHSHEVSVLAEHRIK